MGCELALEGSTMTDGPTGNRAFARLDYETQTADAAERLKHQVLFANRAIQGLLLINGGALIALFWLIGSNSHLRLALNFVWWSFSAFAIGAVLALLASLASYFSQGYYHCTALYQAWDAQQIMCGLSSSRADATKMAFQRGRLAEIAGVAAALFSLIAFMLGCGLALGGVLPRA